MNLVLALMIGCSGPESGDSAPVGDSDLPEQDATCGDADGITLVLPDKYISDDASYTWGVEQSFRDDGGVFNSEDQPWIEATCPPCTTPGKKTYAAYAAVVANAAKEVAYLTVEQVCD
jgi:hypothetical protein